MNRIFRLTALTTFAISPVLAACGGTATHAAVSRTTASATASGPVDCAQARPVIQLLMTAQDKLNASQQTVKDDELYLVSLDEGIAIIKARGWSLSGDQLGSDLSQFESDGSKFTNGDVASQSQVATDIVTLAADCGLASSGS
jgi:hypothetical protein